MVTLLERLQKGERINREEVIAALEKLGKLETHKDPTHLSDHHLAHLDGLGTNVYENNKRPFVLWDGDRLIHMFAEREHDGLWLFNEKRSGKRDPKTGVGENANADRKKSGLALVKSLFSHLMSA